MHRPDLSIIQLVKTYQNNRFLRHTMLSPVITTITFLPLICPNRNRRPIKRKTNQNSKIDCYLFLTQKQKHRDDDLKNPSVEE